MEKNQTVTFVMKDPERGEIKINFSIEAAKDMRVKLNTLFPDQEVERLKAEVIRLQAIIDNADQRAALNRSIRDI